jgi:hypothetical protein
MKKINLLLSFTFCFFFLHTKTLSVTTIPFQYIDGKIVVKVTINKSDYNFIFDTGAFTVISENLKELIPAKHKKIRINFLDSNGQVTHTKRTKIKMDLSDANKQTQQVDVFTLKNLYIDNLEIRNILFSYHNFDKITQRACLKIDGILGANVMDGKVWTIDFQNKRILIEEKTLQPEDSHFFEIPFTKQDVSAIPFVNCTIRNQSVDFVFDTGSDSGIDIEEKIYITIKDNNHLVSEGFLSLSAYVISIGKRELDTMDFVVNGNNFGRQIIDSDTSTVNMIGTKFMENYKVRLDFINNTIFLYPNNGENKLNMKSFGFSVVPLDGKLKIVSKWHIAETSSIELLDEIIQIEDIKIENITDELYCEVQRIMAEREYISIERKDGSKISFRKLNLIDKMP